MFVFSNFVLNVMNEIPGPELAGCAGTTREEGSPYARGWGRRGLRLPQSGNIHTNKFVQKWERRAEVSEWSVLIIPTCS